MACSGWIGRDEWSYGHDTVERTRWCDPPRDTPFVGTRRHTRGWQCLATHHTTQLRLDHALTRSHSSTDQHIGFKQTKQPRTESPLPPLSPPARHVEPLPDRLHRIAPTLPTASRRRTIAQAQDRRSVRRRVEDFRRSIELQRNRTSGEWSTCEVDEEEEGGQGEDDDG